jgi:hypothetical protein
MFRRYPLFIAGLALMACTPFFDTEVPDALGDGSVDAALDAALSDDAAQADGETGDAAVTANGACCIAGATCQDDRTAAQCDTAGGVFSEGLTCEQSGCLPTCREFCAEYVDVCAPFNAFLGRTEWCGEFCSTHAAWSAGTRDEESGNSIACRIYHTGAALEAPDEAGRAFHCGHAGETGGNICGTWCANYCGLAMSICSGEFALFADFEECVTECQTLPDDGTIGDTTGNSVQCRMYHLGAAAESGNRATHCPHASIPSADATCVD